MRWSIVLLEPVHDWFLDQVKNEPMIADKIEEALDELAERDRSWADRWSIGSIPARCTI